MDKNKMANDLYKAIYWYYRRQYAQVTDYIEKENELHNISTKAAEEYCQTNILKLISFLEGK